MVRLLIELGADIEARNDVNYTPLLIAVSQNKPEIARLLIELGANINIEGIFYTPLNYAALHDDIEMVRLLIELGANIEAIDDKGLTIFDKLRKYGKQPMINIIENAVRTREIKENKVKRLLFYLSMIKSKELQVDESASLTSLYDELSNFNPYLLRDIDEYAFGEEEKEKGAEESKRTDAGGRRKKKSSSRKRKSGTRKSKRKSVSRKYCLTTSPRKLGFSQKASCKAQGLLKRTSKKNKGRYVVSPKYKKKKSTRSRK